MKYIAQIFLGGWNNRNYSAEEIIDKLGSIPANVPIDKVIIGWNTDSSVYGKIGDFLHSKGIEMYLWLPVFSEIGELRKARMAEDLWNKPLASLSFQEGENFSFYCPSSKENIDNVISVYEEFFSKVDFDGIFLDKIRTSSFTAGTGGVLSCGCPECAKYCRDNGLDLEALKEVYSKAGAGFWDINEYVPGKDFSFISAAAAKFFRLKGNLIAESVNSLCRYFKNKNKKVGLDLYFPLLSQYVGQNYELLSGEVDFIKPMMYRRTEAPAGIGYEYELLRSNLDGAKSYPDIKFDKAFLAGELARIRHLKCAKYPGIEVNYREDVARTDPKYIKESLLTVKESGMDGAVLCWDIMLAPDEHIKAAGDI